MLDNLGRYGLLGLIAMIIMYRRMFKAFFKPCAQQKWYGYICLLFLVALAFAFLNPERQSDRSDFYCSSVHGII